LSAFPIIKLRRIQKEKQRRRQLNQLFSIAKTKRIQKKEGGRLTIRQAFLKTVRKITNT
jgi:hypothetical protein